MKKSKCHSSIKDNTRLVELIKEQADRINELREENSNLLLALESYRQKEKEISDLINFAKKQSEELRSEAKIKYALECERLKLYRQKWTKILNAKDGETLEKNYDKTLATLKLCQRELEEMLSYDLGENMRDYLAERDRIDDEPILDYKAIIEDNTFDEAAQLQNLTNEEIQDLLNQL